MAKEMLINTLEGHESRIAILEDGELEELYIERASTASQVGNVYKGRVTNVEPSIQAAFIDFGGPKNGFLHISDLHPQYFPKGQRGTEPVGRKKPQRQRPPIQECLRRGQEVLVQMTKEGIGTKGPTLTTYLSLPGRLLVMMPGMSKLGVSRKIDDPQARTQARKLLAELSLPSQMGFIVRTAGLNRTKRDVQRDLKYLLRLWKTINQRAGNARAPAEIYQESDLVTRTIRDVYSPDIKRILCDREPVARRVAEFLRMIVPRSRPRIELYTGRLGLFHELGVEEKIEQIYSPRVELPSGGSLIIEQAEALVAIDVNTGRFRGHRDAETTALKLDQEAAREITRQLRLRDMGGVIVIDFIDLAQQKNRRAVERTLRDALKKDRAKTKVLHMSAFGIVEMTRQRVRPPLKQSIYRTCDQCDGMGLIKSEESQALMVLRDIERAASSPDVAGITAEVTPAVALHLANQFRHLITGIEKESAKGVSIQIDRALSGGEYRIGATNARGSAVAWEPPASKKGGNGGPETIPLEELDRTRQAEAEAEQQAEAAAAEAPSKGPAPKKKSRRRGKRGGRKHKRPKDKAAEAQPEPEAQPQAQAPGEQKPSKSQKRRRRRAAKSKEAPKGTEGGGEQTQPRHGHAESPPAGRAERQKAPSPEESDKGRPRKGRKSARKGPSSGAGGKDEAPADA